MRVMILSPHWKELLPAIEEAGDDPVLGGTCEMAVMYGHREILTKEQIEKFPLGVLNIHNSLLPWNRGAHPNFWSWFDQTPKGVTIHRVVDKGIDTGPIMAALSMIFPSDNTLRSTYEALHQSAIDMFYRSWKHLRSTASQGSPQNKLAGSYHRSRDLEPWWPLLSKGWDTPISEVMELGHRPRGTPNGKAVNGMDAERS